MLFGIVASNEDESRFFAIAAPSEAVASEIVRGTVGDEYQLHSQDLEDLLHAQYGQISELVTS